MPRYIVVNTFSVNVYLCIVENKCTFSLDRKDAIKFRSKITAKKMLAQYFKINTWNSSFQYMRMIKVR